MTETKVRSFVDDVDGVFSAYHEHEDGRECITGDLVERGAAELAREFRQAEKILEGVLYSAESVSYGYSLVMGDALRQARRARQAAERYV